MLQQNASPKAASPEYMLKNHHDIEIQTMEQEIATLLGKTIEFEVMVRVFLIFKIKPFDTWVIPCLFYC
jgi:hypothetical protein